MSHTGSRAPSRLGWAAAALLGAALVGALLVGPELPAQDAGQKARPADLARVPGDAVGFITVRLADLWTSDLTKEFRAALAKDGKMLDELKRGLGAVPADIERLTYLLADLQGGEPLAVVATIKPYDPAKVLAAALPKAKEEKVKENRTLFVDGRRAIHFVNDRVYILGGGDQIGALLDRPAAKGGPLHAALDAAAGKHLMTASVNPGSLPPDLVNNLPPQAEPFAPLLKARSTLFTIDADKQAEARLRVQFTKAGDTKEGTVALKVALELGGQLLGQGREELAKHPDLGKELHEALVRLETALKNAKVEAKEAEVVVTVSADLKPVLGAALVEAMQKVRIAASRAQSQNNLKQLAIAMHNYHDVHGSFPPHAVYSNDGKPLLSWRVLLLPFLEQDNLYKQFKLDEPWDSEHNKKLLDQLPPVFAGPHPKEGQTDTLYQALVGKGTIFDGAMGITLAGITDGTSNTIMFVEAAKPVPWTKPADLPYDAGKPLPKFGGMFPNGFSAAFCDGSVRFISDQTPEQTLRAMITANGGEVICGQ